MSVANDLAGSQLLAQVTDERSPALAELVELVVKAANEVAGGAVGDELLVLPAAQVELELGARDCDITHTFSHRLK
jgi:hypothetical protein